MRSPFGLQTGSRQRSPRRTPQSAYRVGLGPQPVSLVASIAAIGVKTQLKELAPVGVADPADVGESLFLVALVLALQRLPLL
jgi:hypothetical protein